MEQAIAEALKRLDALPIEVTDWEAGFIDSCLRRQHHSPKQKAVLARMVEQYLGNLLLALKCRSFTLPPEEGRIHSRVTTAPPTERIAQSASRWSEGVWAPGQEHTGCFALVQRLQSRLKPGTFPPLPLKGRGFHGLKAAFCDGLLAAEILGQQRLLG